VKGFSGMRDEISVIRTPDQRLRVFVSSTLKELAEERAAFAGVCTQEGKYEISAQLLGSANALLNKTGGSWWPADRMDIEPNREISRNNLDGEVFESAWEVGQGMELSTVFELVETIQQLFASTYWSINCQLSLFYTLNGSI
jgi:hypothetical protein